MMTVIKHETRMADNVEDMANTLEEATLLPDSEPTVCNICGENHFTDLCTLINELKPVKDTPTMSRARLTLPSGLKVVNRADHSTAVMACVKFKRGSHFGPLQALLTTDLHPGVSLPLKIFGKSRNEGYYLDTTDEETCNWMCLVAPASTASEQNLICYDMKQSIYFTAIKDILPGDELKVWYALYYGLKLQALPLADDVSDSEDGFVDSPDNALEPKIKTKANLGQEIDRELLESLAQHLPARSLGARVPKDCWQCALCDQQEGNVSLYAKHLMTHYRPQCALCNLRFCNEQALSKHQKKRHGSSEGDGEAATPQGDITDNINITVAPLDASNVQEPDATDEAEESFATAENREPRTDESEQMKIENYESFCPLMNTRELITINNPNTSESVQTQLVLADDGSVVYQVANIPEGILATEMDKFGLLVTNDENCSQTESWNAEMDSTAQDTLENDKARINDSKVELENSSVALLLLSTLEKDSQLQESQNLQEISRVDLNEKEVAEECKESAGCFACDICSKTFVKSAYLYRHLRKHTGEFTCVNCLAVFARKENLQSHACIRPKVRHPCHICGKKFSGKKYLQRHISLHTGKFTCDKCKRSFVSKISLACHRCRPDDLSKDSVKCRLCEQTFTDKANLQMHLVRHSESDLNENRAHLANTPWTRRVRMRKPTAKVMQPECISISLGTNGSEVKMLSLPAEENISTEKDSGRGFICEICGSIFKSFSSMKTHRYLHGERRFECKICGKRFHRKDVLQEHITVHQGPQLPCSECGKKLKTKKSLEVHMMIHVGAKRFTCEDCGKEFHQKGNLLKHQRVHTPPADRIFPCQHCKKTFTSREYLTTHTLEHTQGKIFECTQCSKSFVKKHLLEAHHQSAHSNKAFLCPFCNTLMRLRHAARRHLEQQHPERRAEWARQGFVDGLLAELPADSVLLSTAGSVPKHPGIRQEQLLAVRKQHFGTNLTLPEGTGKEDLIVANLPMEAPSLTTAIESAKVSENQDVTLAEMATFTLDQHVNLLADDLLGTPELQLDEINAIPVSFEEKKQGEEILLEVVNPPGHENATVGSYANSVVDLPFATPGAAISPEENAQVTIGGNTYILQDPAIFGEDEMPAGDVFLYVLDATGQQ